MRLAAENPALLLADFRREYGIDLNRCPQLLPAEFAGLIRGLSRSSRLAEEVTNQAAAAERTAPTVADSPDLGSFSTLTVVAQ